MDILVKWEKKRDDLLFDLVVGKAGRKAQEDFAMSDIFGDGGAWKLMQSGFARPNCKAE